MRLPIHLTSKCPFWNLKKKSMTFMVTCFQYILTILKNIFHFENVTLKLKFWAILSVYPSIYSFTTNFFS